MSMQATIGPTPKISGVSFLTPPQRGDPCSRVAQDDVEMFDLVDQLERLAAPFECCNVVGSIPSSSDRAWVATTSLAMPPGTSSATRACSRQHSLVRQRAVSVCRLASSRHTVTDQPGAPPSATVRVRQRRRSSGRRSDRSSSTGQCPAPAPVTPTSPAHRAHARRRRPAAGTADSPVRRRTPPPTSVAR